MRLGAFSGSSAVQRRLHGVHSLCDTVCLQCWGGGGRFGLVVHPMVATSVCAKVEMCSRCWRRSKHFREDSPIQWEPSQRSSATRQHIHHSHRTVLSPGSPLSKQESCHDSHEALFGLPEKRQEQEMVMGHGSYSKNETGGQHCRSNCPQSCNDPHWTQQLWCVSVTKRCSQRLSQATFLEISLGQPLRFCNLHFVANVFPIQHPL